MMTLAIIANSQRNSNTAIVRKFWQPQRQTDGQTNKAQQKNGTKRFLPQTLKQKRSNSKLNIHQLHSQSCALKWPIYATTSIC